MRVLFGTTTVTTAGTRVQLSNTAEKVKNIKFQARAANTGRMFIGKVDVSATVNGWELAIPDPAGTTRAKAVLEVDYETGSEVLSVFYADSTVNGEKIDWVAIVE